MNTFIKHELIKFIKIYSKDIALQKIYISNATFWTFYRSF